MICENNPAVTKVDLVYILVFFIRRVFGYDYWRNTEEENFGISLNVFPRLCYLEIEVLGRYGS